MIRLKWQIFHYMLIYVVYYFLLESPNLDKLAILVGVAEHLVSYGGGFVSKETVVVHE